MLGLLGGHSWNGTLAANPQEEDLPVGLRLALQDLAFAGHIAELVLVGYEGHAKAPAASHAAPYHEPVAGLEDVERHLLSCINLSDVSDHHN